MAVGTFVAARSYLVEQRERSASQQAFANASYVRDGLLTAGARVSDVIGTVSPPAESAILVRRGDRWFSSSLDVGQADLPTPVQRAVADGHAALGWNDTPDGRAVVVGVPLPAVDAQYYQQAVTTELTATLDTLRVVLGIVALLTALAGAVLGRWAARRVISPLDDVADAAAKIASGSLTTRLDSTDDPDLATIVASFNSMVDAVNERIARDARFAADVSHELRSPLTALVTSVDVLERRRAGLSPPAQQALDLIHRDLDRFQRALQDLLDLGRMEAGASTLVLVEVDVRDLVLHATEAVGVEPHLVTMPEVGARVRVDKAAMHRALVNLLENAALHGGGVSAVGLEVRGDRALVTVDDEGPGVPPGDRTRIFERFVRGGSRGSLPGTGLGLSLVAETARVHGGAVWCADGSGGAGARFCVELPAVPAELPT